ncbi:MAG: hypothetical protein GC190_09955 [Alphaproteobacteria bacterium]|nr:hypothetical protein [Alphaproteobacteria bacterium]
MFGIHWLNGRKLVEKQTSELALLSEVVAAARRCAADVSSRHRGNAPDSFKIFNETGRELGQYTLL